MNWPDDYLIPGIEPYHQEEAGIIYCGDCLSLVPKLLDKCIDMIFTDPPYGHNNNNGDLIAKRESALGRGPSGPPRPICNDGPEAEELAEFLFSQSPRILKEEGCCCCCCCCGGGPDPMFARWSLMMDKHLSFKQMVVWDKGPMGMGWHYRRSYETILVGQKGDKCKWYDDSDKIENIIRPGKYGIKKIIPSKKQHPTEKPKQLSALFIRLHSQVGEVILDPFMGHGSTIESAKELGRKFIGIEISEEYCAIAVKRLRQGVLNFG
jgi:DNA modification methylase